MLRPSASCWAARQCPNASKTTAIPLPIERLSENDRLKGALVWIDAIAPNPAIAATITAAGADDLLALEADPPTSRAEVTHLFDDAVAGEVETHTEHEKGHGRIQARTVS